MYIIHNSEFINWTEDPFAYDGEKFHAVLCDPPYGISFMGKDWDKPDAFRRSKNENGVGRDSVFGRTSRTSPEYSAGLDFQKQAQSWGEALMPLLYPGAIVMMFSGTRMWHRLAAGMEDAGFHLWDTLMWLHGQGFPKAQAIDALIDKKNGDIRPIIGSKTKGSSPLPGNHDKDLTWADGQKDGVFDVTSAASAASAVWTGYKTPQFKPAWEPVLCFKAPTNEKYADLALKYGSGCLNVDAGRIGTATPAYGGGALGGATWNKENCGLSKSGAPRPVDGRYPANLALNEESAIMLDEQTGILTSGKSKPEYRKKAKNNVFGIYANDDMPINVIGDSGGASRFFYVSKASRGERELGLDGFVEAKTDETRNVNQPSMNDGEGNPFNSSVKGVRNNHPTVKPIKLNTWLASLLLPPDTIKSRRILVPFSGSGSEMIGCMLAGWDQIIGVEMDSNYCKIAEARLKYWSENNKGE